MYWQRADVKLNYGNPSILKEDVFPLLPEQFKISETSKIKVSESGFVVQTS